MHGARPGLAATVSSLLLRLYLEITRHLRAAVRDNRPSTRSLDGGILRSCGTVLQAGVDTDAEDTQLIPPRQGSPAAHIQPPRFALSCPAPEPPPTTNLSCFHYSSFPGCSLNGIPHERPCGTGLLLSVTSWRSVQLAVHVSSVPFNGQCILKGLSVFQEVPWSLEMPIGATALIPSPCRRAQALAPARTGWGPRAPGSVGGLSVWGTGLGYSGAQAGSSAGRKLPGQVCGRRGLRWAASQRGWELLSEASICFSGPAVCDIPSKRTSPISFCCSQPSTPTSAPPSPQLRWGIRPCQP